MRHVLLTVIGLLAWFLIVAPVTFSQVLCGQMGTALNCVGPDGSTSIIAPMSPNTGMIMDDKGGMEPYLLLTPPASSGLTDMPRMPEMPRMETGPAPSFDPLPPLSTPSYDSGYGSSGYGGYGGYGY